MIKSKIESLLFVAGKPLTAKKIAEMIGVKEAEVESALKELQDQYAQSGAGVQLFSTGREWQMGTSGKNASVVSDFVKDEFSGELTRPQLEALTVIAYRGPISKMQLEIIRGVNCSLILRNLMIRGLVDEEYDSKKKENLYRASLDFLRHLGLRKVEELPDYEALHSETVITTLLQQQQVQQPSQS